MTSLRGGRSPPLTRFQMQATTQVLHTLLHASSIQVLHTNCIVQDTLTCIDTSCRNCICLRLSMAAGMQMKRRRRGTDEGGARTGTRGRREDEEREEKTRGHEAETWSLGQKNLPAPSQHARPLRGLQSTGTLTASQKGRLVRRKNKRKQETAGTCPRVPPPPFKKGFPSIQ